INASNSGAESCTGIGVVAGCVVVVLIRQGPLVKQGDTRWRIPLRQRLQEVRRNYKTRNHLIRKNVLDHSFWGAECEIVRPAPRSTRPLLSWVAIETPSHCTCIGGYR